MDISANVNGSSNVDHIGLFCEDLSKYLAKYLALSQSTLISC